MLELSQFCILFESNLTEFTWSYILILTQQVIENRGYKKNPLYVVA